jgi:hypothetical protein
MDGDLGPNDAVEVRLRAADTIILLDFSLIRCAWRALWRSRERADFWRWLVAYRFQSRPILMQAVAEHAASPDPGYRVTLAPSDGSSRRSSARLVLLE